MLIVLASLVHYSSVVAQSTVQKKQTLRSDTALMSKIDQMIMIGFRGMDGVGDIESVLQKTNLGGVILFDYDSPTKRYVRNIQSPKQLKTLITTLQSKAKTQLFVAIDEEGGKVSRLKSRYGFADGLPSQSKMATMDIDSISQLVTKRGSEIADLGINVDFAPVVDVAPDTKTSDSASLIARQMRIYSNDVDTVVRYAAQTVQKLQDKNILPVAKHFPGQGSARGDSHRGITDVSAVYKNYELLPYTKLLSMKLLPAVMVSHVINKNIDAQYPASLSKKHIEKLRVDASYDGLIFSDDYDMGAVRGQYDLSSIVTHSINAGVDVLVFSNNISGYDRDMVYKVRNAIYDAVISGNIQKSRIDESTNRIMKVKKLYKVVL